MPERDDTGWWLVEPPDSEFEPPAYTDSDEYRHADLWGEEDFFEATMWGDEVWHDQVITLKERPKLYDGAKPQDLFQGVQIRDDGSFVVPERYIQTPRNGVWCFKAFGHRRTFKDRDEYGDIRFLQSGGEIARAIWVPHLYPFEETDTKGLPLIRDRERAELMVVLSNVQGKDIYPSHAEITVDGQLYGAQESIEFFMGDGNKYFSEFAAVGKKLVAETVEYPEEQWSNLEDYLDDKNRTDDYHDIMMDKLPMPEEYARQYEPLGWQTRQPAPHEGNAFGTIWVPADELRRGIHAEIIFPRFTELDTEA